MGVCRARTHARTHMRNFPLDRLKSYSKRCGSYALSKLFTCLNPRRM